MRDAIADFVAAAEGMIGTPFHHQGKIPGVGLDCVGLIYCAARAAGFRVPLEFEDERGYSKAINHGRFIRAMRRRFDELGADSIPSAGDVPVLWKSRRGRAQHCGVIDSDGRLIHCTDERGVIRQHYGDFWRARTIATFRLGDQWRR